jgi:hypothetical protein
MTDVAEDTTQLQIAVRSFLSAVEPEERVAFASLVYYYSGRHDVRYNGRILCARVAPASASPPDLQAGGPPLVDCPNCLFSIFVAIHHNLRPSPPPVTYERDKMTT